jgi:hypothetical protein
LIAHFFIKGKAARPLYREAKPVEKKLVAVALATFVAWILVAIPVHSPMANRRHLEQLVNDRKYPEAIAFASGKTRADFPPHHHLPPAPSPWFNPQLLLDLPADAPAWLRDEWIQNAIESRKAGMFQSRDEWELVNARYPEIPAAIARYASELRARAEKLDGDESRWLSIYESQQDKAAASP